MTYNLGHNSRGNMYRINNCKRNKVFVFLFFFLGTGDTFCPRMHESDHFN